MVTVALLVVVTLAVAATDGDAELLPDTELDTVDVHEIEDDALRVTDLVLLGERDDVGVMELDAVARGDCRRSPGS